MYPLGHLTVACGALWVSARIRERSGEPDSAPAVESSNVGQNIDYRLVALGALLPDLIDKPIAWIIIRDQFAGNGHLYGHTLLAALMVLLPGLILLLRWRDLRLFAMGVAMLSHLAGDGLNLSPHTLMWPLFGADFPHVTLLGVRATLATEVFAGLLALAAIWTLRRRRRLWVLVREGRP